MSEKQPIPYPNINALINPRPGWSKSRSANAELRGSRVPVWTIIKHLDIRAAGLSLKVTDPEIVEGVAVAYDVSQDSVEAAIAFYDRHKKAIGRRLNTPEIDLNTPL